MDRDRKVVLVTGSGRGIGRGTALEFGRRGYDVVVHHRQEPEGSKEVADVIREMGVRAEILAGDLMEDGVAERLVEDSFDLMGRLDVLVNNAGITVFQPFTELSSDQFERVFRTDFRAAFKAAQTAARLMKERRTHGNIVNITSVHYERATNHDSIYGSMKAALARATESMAYELGPFGIRVNAVAPGLTLLSKPTQEQRKWLDAVESGLPLRRAGQIEDVAKAVAWLASEEASYITGITLRVDGGMNLPMPQAMMDGRMFFF